MTKEQYEKLIETVVEQTSDRVVIKLESRVYQGVGRTVIEKGLAAIGISAIAVAFFFQNNIWPFHK